MSFLIKNIFLNPFGKLLTIFIFRWYNKKGGMMEKYAHAERRGDVRVFINVSMRLVVFDGDTIGLSAKESIKLRTGVIRDLSISGACIKTNDLLDIWLSAMRAGLIKVALKFQLPDFSEPVNANSKVMWIKESEKSSDYKYTLGLKFMDLSESDNVKIARYIIKHQSKDKEKKH